MQEAQSDSLDDYESFNAFFTRALKEEARPIDSHHNGIACPADGVVSQAGNISENKILQAKGIDYSVSRILGSSTEASHYKNGSFATIYLSPKDYHSGAHAHHREITADTLHPGRIIFRE